jgi:hypothetical protein
MIYQTSSGSGPSNVPWKHQVNQTGGWNRLLRSCESFLMGAHHPEDRPCQVLESAIIDIIHYRKPRSTSRATTFASFCFPKLVHVESCDQR